MQKNDMVEKIKILVDGVEFPLLVSMEEVVYEEGTVEVPEFKRTRILKNGVKKIPIINCVFKVQRDSTIISFLKSWFENDEVHDIIKIRTDGAGIEFARTLFTSCESAKYSEPAYDGANPTYAQINCSFIPYDLILQ